MSESRPPGGDPPALHLVELLARGLREYREAVRDALRQSGSEDVPRSGSWLLTSLVHSPGTVGELAERLGTTKQGLSRLSDALVERGYLCRNSDPSDHRLVRLVLTDRGRAAAKTTLAAAASVDRSIERRAGRDAAVRAQQALRALFGAEDAR
ncbi:MAG TPA: MarR family transcriptional regulator [Candidatus Dormibacteraeota bacterium]|nr:MarR family transcriptional regulator [Candidatus Dormibacteraeota bacterium]